MKFPLYRKYSNNKSYFKVLNEIEFEELKFIGQKIELYKVKATQYPEKLFIKELIENAEKISGEDYEIIFNKL
ncbi:MAG: hypothetical protein LCH32_04890 [Bacteroidetes bacterium]|nr:hypothetical protein [Bacteroidota bacterium]